MLLKQVPTNKPAINNKKTTKNFSISVSTMESRRHEINANVERESKRIKLMSTFDPLVKKIMEFGAIILNKGPKSAYNERRWRSNFGVSPEICAELWHRIGPSSLPVGSKLEHLLWALILLKGYPIESVACSLIGGHDEQTFREQAWFFVEAISYLELDIISAINTLHVHKLICY